MERELLLVKFVLSIIRQNMHDVRLPVSRILVRVVAEHVEHPGWGEPPGNSSAHVAKADDSQSLHHPTSSSVLKK